MGKIIFDLDISNTPNLELKSRKQSISTRIIEDVRRMIKRVRVNEYLGEHVLLRDGIINTHDGYNKAKAGGLPILCCENKLCEIWVDLDGTVREPAMHDVAFSVDFTPEKTGQYRHGSMIFDNKDNAFLLKQVERIKYEEAAYFRAEQRFMMRDPINTINGMTPENALVFLEKLREETL